MPRDPEKLACTNYGYDAAACTIINPSTGRKYQHCYPNKCLQFIKKVKA